MKSTMVTAVYLEEVQLSDSSFWTVQTWDDNGRSDPKFFSNKSEAHEYAVSLGKDEIHRSVRASDEGDLPIPRHSVIVGCIRMIDAMDEIPRGW